MTRSFGLVDYKVQEAEYFLLELVRVAKRIDFGAVQFCASAFVSAARSVTFAMQSSLKGLHAFEDWYAPRQEKLRNDSLARFFHDFRTVTQHIGVNVVGGGSHGNDGTYYYFVPCPDLPKVPELDVLSACNEYFVSVLQLVFDCYVELGPIVDGQQYSTAENFHALGKTIADAEEELGMLRNWTDIGRPDTEPYRWELLRRQADGCDIEVQFERWLGRYLPRPPKLPPYQPQRLTIKDHMLNWAYFPRSDKPTFLVRAVVKAFEESHPSITSEEHTLPSNAVLAHVAPQLAELGFSVETGKKKAEKIRVPVLYGNNGRIAKAFEADAHHIEGKLVVEVEAGRAVLNNQFLKDLFQACMMDDIDYLAIAVRNVYEAASAKNPDFERVVTFFETMYASNRMKLPLQGILVIGY